VSFLVLACVGKKREKGEPQLLRFPLKISYSYDYTAARDPLVAILIIAREIVRIKPGRNVTRS